jgi:hypothetical protein
MIEEKDLKLFRFAETAEAAWECLLHGGLKPYAEPDWEAPPADRQDLA